MAAAPAAPAEGMAVGVAGMPGGGRLEPVAPLNCCRAAALVDGDLVPVEGVLTEAVRLLACGVLLPGKLLPWPAIVVAIFLSCWKMLATRPGMALPTLSEKPERVGKKDDRELFPEEKNKMGGGRGGGG